METELITKKFGGSIGIIFPKELLEKKRIKANDLVRIRVEKVADLRFMFGKGKDVKKSTEKIMKEIDEGEDD